MPTLSWPGVYVEEIPSGVHAITGVPTSITAFIGRALRGPTNTPTTVTSSADFGRQFGGLGLGYPMSYAVRDFFANGGGQAVIVRVWEGAATSSATSASSSSLSSASSISSSLSSASSTSSSLSAGSSSSSSSSFALPPQADGIARTNLTDPDTIGLALEAQSPGKWGDKVTVQVAIPSPAPDATTAANLGYASASDLFNLLVTDGGSGASETIRNVSVVDGLRRLDKVLPSESQLVAVPIDPVTLLPILPGTTPSASANAIPLSGGDDGNIITSAQTYVPSDGSKRGIYALDNASMFNLLSIPPDSAPPDSMSWIASGTLYQGVYPYALQYCHDKSAFFVVDPPYDWTSVDVAKGSPSVLNLTTQYGSYGAIYFPMLVESDPLQQGRPTNVAPSGAMCGIMASTDNTDGVWKAPAGIAASFVGVQGLSVQLNDADSGLLNPVGVNCLRNFPFIGNVAWGARTLRGADVLTDDYKYVPVRRTALFLELSLQQGLKWVVFEPNADPLWASIRLNVQSFMQDLFTKHAFAGTTPKDAYFVKCDSETTTPYDQSIGVVNIIVGFAPLYPAEFVVLQIQQLAGQTGA